MRQRLAVLGVYVTTCLLYLCCRAINPACDCVVYQSYGLNAGRFTSPNHPKPYPSSINCILYSFIGDATEIIELKFVEFNLKMPDESGRCVDFLRVYQNLERPEVNEYSQHDIEMCGRYSSIQNTIYSSGRSMVLEFHADLRRGTPGNYSGFNGIYKFLDKKSYITTGTRVQGKPCTYDFHSNDTHRFGKFFSPFYPQNYKPLSSCRYRFHARRSERVNIEFSNIHLHHIDASCRDSPDVIMVHDGTDETAPVIGQFCGMHNKEEFVSTGPNLFVTFACDDRDQRQGFAATYKFTSKSSMVPKSVKNQSADGWGMYTDSNTGVIPIDGSDGGVIRPGGPKYTCNKNIDSRTQRNGTITSPLHPEAYPAEITCRYIFTGVGRERIQLEFKHIDLHYRNGNPAEPIDCKRYDSVSVIIFVGGKTKELDTWCGRKLPPMLMSSQPKLIVEFRSYHSRPEVTKVTGFLAQYNFVTDFGIKGGEQDNRGTCVFNYRATQKTSGEIWSPNYPGLYPRNTECHYLFYGRSSEQVRIQFMDFDVDGINPDCEESTNSDYVSFSNFADTEDRKMTRLCGLSANSKSEIWSDGPFFRVIFKSNHIYDSTGFRAYYHFISSRGEPSGDHHYSVDNRGIDALPSSHGDGTGKGSDCRVMTSSLCLCLIMSMFAVLSRQVSCSLEYLVSSIDSQL